MKEISRRTIDTMVTCIIINTITKLQPARRGVTIYYNLFVFMTGKAYHYDMKLFE